MRAVAAVVAAALAGCQPMYPPHSEPLPKPAETKRPVDKPDPAPPIVFVEDCDMRSKPTTTEPKRDGAAAEREISAAKDNLHKADATTVPAERKQLVAQSIDELVEALRKDPYNPSATLELALAYDRVLYKGCALALLSRLGKLGDRYPKEAEPVIDDVVANRNWFARYRQDAMRAINHP